MVMKRVVVVAYVADQAAAAAIAAAVDEFSQPLYEGATGIFGVGVSKWAHSTGVPVGEHTDVAVSGDMDEDLVEAYRLSSHPKFQVIDNPDDIPMATICAGLTPPLYLAVEVEEV